MEIKTEGLENIVKKFGTGICSVVRNRFDDIPSFTLHQVQDFIDSFRMSIILVEHIIEHNSTTLNERIEYKRIREVAERKIKELQELKDITER